VHDLARQAAARTGRSQTSVIELALERLLASLDAENTRLDALLAGIQADIARGRPLSTDDLYDDTGLPR
jgi:antitoxin VapB